MNLLTAGGRVTVRQPYGQVAVVHDARPAVTVLTATSDVVIAATAGPQGAQGQTGGAGPQGATGPLGGYLHPQDTPSASWQFTHTVGRIPVVIVYDKTNRRMFPDTQVTDTQVALTFAFPMAGTAILL